MYMKKNIAKAFLLVFSIGMVSCSKSDDYSSTYEFPTILKIVGGSNDILVSGTTGYNAKFSTYYLGSSVDLIWTSSSPDVSVSTTPGNITEANFFFKPGGPVGKIIPITITVTASNGIVGTKTLNVQYEKVPIGFNNKYKGIYTESGTLRRVPVSGTTTITALSGDLFIPAIDDNTLNPQVAKSVLNNSASTFLLRVNANGTITIERDPSSPDNIVPQPGTVSSYDPVTKTFDLHYQLATNSGTVRYIDSKLKFKSF